MARHKTEFPGVFYRKIDHNGHREKSYYIVYKIDGKVCEEQVGRHIADGMRPGEAASIRAERKSGHATARRKAGMPESPARPAAWGKKAGRGKPAGDPEKNISAKIPVEKDFRHPMEVTRLMLDYSNDAIYITQDGVTKFVNSKIEEMTGYSSDELMDRWSFELTHPDDRGVILDRYAKRMRGEEVPNYYPHRIFDRWGNVKWIEVNAVLVSWEGKPAVLNFVRDITKRKAAEDALKEMNTALDALLKKRENDVRETEEKIVSNIRGLVLPYVLKLKSASLEHSQAVLVDIVEKHLREISSPFLSRLTSRYAQLSPRETQVAELIKNGMTTKEIARTLHISTNAVDIYRLKIRKKLGLNREKVSLSSFLNTLGHQL